MEDSSSSGVLLEMLFIVKKKGKTVKSKEATIPVI